MAFLASVLIHLMVLFAVARWLETPQPVPEIQPEAPLERITRVMLPPAEMLRTQAPPPPARRPPTARNAPERPQPRPEAKDRMSIGGPAAERQKTPLELRRDEDITRQVARGRRDATGSPASPAPAPPQPPATAAAPEVAALESAETEAPFPETAAEMADAPLAPSPRPIGPPRPPGGAPSIADSLRSLEGRLRADGPRGLESGTAQQMGPLLFDPRGADFTAWVNQFRIEVYRNWIVPQSVAFGARGHVDLEFLVERDGRVSAVRLIRSSGTPALDRAARNALLGGRFLPLPSDFRPNQLAIQVSFFYNSAG